MLVTLMICFLIHMFKNTAEGLTARSYEQHPDSCHPGEVAERASRVIRGYSRGHPAFLQLAHFLWNNKQAKYGLPLGFRGDEEEAMKLLASLEDFSIPHRIRRLRCRRCVVVGNGQRLFNSSLGKVIDEYDIVIRLNHAPVKNFERDVGNKTTIRLFYPESAQDRPEQHNNPDTLMVLVPYKGPDLFWTKGKANKENWTSNGYWKSSLGFWNVKNKNIRVLNPYFTKFAAFRMLGKKYNWRPTLGLSAISFAIHFCDQVHIAGFGYPSINDSQSIHYFGFDSVKIMYKSTHSVPLEAKAVKKLLRNNVIKNLTIY